MSSVGMLPIIIIFTGIFLLCSGVILSLSKLQFMKRKSSSKKHALFFKLYASILVVSLLISIVFPSSKGETLEDSTWDYDGGSYFYNVLDGDVPIEEIAIFKQTDNTYPLEGSTLHMNERNDNHFYYDMIEMLIVKDPSLQSEFRVETYVTPYLYNAKDITPYLQLIDITAKDDRLVIHFPTEEVSISMYEYSFPFKQFLGEDRRLRFDYDYVQYRSRQLAIIYIPTDVEPNVSQLLDSGMYHIEMLTIEE